MFVIRKLPLGCSSHKGGLRDFFPASECALRGASGMPAQVLLNYFAALHQRQAPYQFFCHGF